MDGARGTDGEWPERPAVDRLHPTPKSPLLSPPAPGWSRSGHISPLVAHLACRQKSEVVCEFQVATRRFALIAKLLD